MKLKNINEVNAFKNAVNKCKGKVWLRSPEGDEFNLNSVFSQYLGLGALLSENGDNLELFCQFTEDESYFYDFLNNNPQVR